MFSIFTHVMKPVGDTNSHLGLHWLKKKNFQKKVRVPRYVCYRLSGAYGYKIVDSNESVCDIFKSQFGFSYLSFLFIK